MAGESLAAPLFETGGPQKFKESLDQVAASVKSIGTQFDDLSKRAQSSLSLISKQLDEVLAKAQRLGPVGSRTAAAGGGAGATGNGGVQGNVTRNGGLVGRAAGYLQDYFSMQEMGVGGQGIGGMTTFGQILSARGATPMSPGGTPVGGGASATGGAPGYGQWSWGRAAAGTFMAAQGAAAKATAQNMDTGTTWRQMEFATQLGTGGAMGQNAAGRYASQFTGWGGDVGNLMGGMQSLSGVPGVGLPGGQGFTRAASQAGALAMISQSVGGNLTFADTASAQNTLSSMRGRMALGASGMGNLAPQNTNLFTVAQMVAQHMAPAGRPFTARQLAQQATSGGPVFNALSKLAERMGLDPQVVRAQMSYLEANAMHGNRSTLGDSGLTAKQEASNMKMLGFSGTDVNKQFAAAESQARMGRTRAEGEADAASALNQAAEKMLQAAEAWSGLSGGLGHMLGMGTGALGSKPGSWLSKGLNIGMGVMRGLFGGSSSSGNAGGYSPTSALGTTTATGVMGGGSGTAVVNDAMRYLGVPYKWGGTNPKTGLDCSGLVQLAYKDVGISLPRTSQQMARVGSAVSSLSQAQPGDLLLYAGSDGTPSSPGHVGIYVGGNKMLDAPHTGSRVQVEPVWSGLVGIRRVVGSLGSSGNNANAGGTTAMSANASGGISTVGGSLAEGGMRSESSVLASALTASFSSAGGSSGAVGGAPGNTMGVGSVAGGTPVGPIPTGAHLALIKQSLGLAGIADTPANESAVNTIVTHESGWNPNAINRTDSNAKAGHPSQSLMQTIPSTFKSYAIPGYNKNINDPLSNLIAGERYAVSRYGSLTNVPGVKAVAAGGRYVGYEVGSQYIERDHLAMLHKGEMVMRAGTASAMRMNQLSGGGGGSGVSVVFQRGAIVYSPGGDQTASPSSSIAQDMDDLAARLEAALQRRLSRTKVAAE